ncbi:MAG: arginase family protein [Bacteroidia bacterium]|nr:arginase family protein [Bacteroidia bacterium]MDW8236271.1 arginase family protein [Bacteroidia bacterium]
MERVQTQESPLIFGRRTTWEEATFSLIAVPWEGSTSFRKGTAYAPEEIRIVSSQIDYFRSECPTLESKGIYWSAPASPLPHEGHPEHLYQAYVLPFVQAQVKAALMARKRFGIIGGDHSVPLGAHFVLESFYPEYGVLYIDAHADLRSSYEGNRYSHATIFYHVSLLPSVSKIVGIGIRDWSSEEMSYARRQYPRLVLYEMRRIMQGLYRGRPWVEIVSEVISLLPEKVYVSIDVDGLDVGYVPNTGTPVPGGLRYEELFFLLEAIPHSGREIIGFDVCETGGAQLDAIVAAHLIYRLCGLVLCSEL